MVQPRETPHDAGSRRYRPLETWISPDIEPCYTGTALHQFTQTLAPDTPPAEELSAWCTATIVFQKPAYGAFLFSVFSLVLCQKLNLKIILGQPLTVNLIISPQNRRCSDPTFTIYRWQGER